MIRYHLITALLLVLYFEEGTTDKKDDCFNYDKVYSLSYLAFINIGFRCPADKCTGYMFRSVAKACVLSRCIDDLADAFICLTNVEEKLAEENPVKVDISNIFEKYGNQDKLDALKEIRDKCTKESHDIQYISNCIVRKMADVCPDDEFFKEDEGDCQL